MMYEILMI